jgi:exoribonuclease R
MLKHSKGFDNQKTTNTAYFELSKYIKHGQDKILQNYSLIKTALSKLSLSLPSEYQDTFTTIITDLITMKEKFKKYIDTISMNISSLYETCLSENSTNNSDTPSLSPRIKNSYDSISDEFDKLEKVTRNIIQTKHTLFKKKQQRTAEKIIENLMLLAGESYANYMIIPSPLRVHEAPDEERVEEAFETLEKSGIRVKSTHDIVNGKVIQQLLSQIDDMDERTVAAQIILRSMSRARYDVENVGHFGLGLPTYGHWTSPIRRAADLRGHYNLRLQRDNKFEIKDADAFYDMMDEFCQHISRKERNADQAERDADEFEMIKYMKNHLGEKFNAHITYVNSKVMFVKTEQGITGRLYAEDIQGDKFNYNDATLSFNGKKSKKKLRIGTKLVLTALEADRDFGSISFGVQQEDLPLIKAKRRA